MKRNLTLILAGVIGLIVLAKSTNLYSYATTAWSQAKNEAKRQVPTKFELERIRHEVANLDQDITHMIRPVAEYKAVIDRLRKDIGRAEAKVDEQKMTLLSMTEDLKDNPKTLVYAGVEYPASRVKEKLNNDFEAFKRLEAHTKAQRKLLEAKEKSLKASQEQLAKVVTKKKEYELRLAQLEAEEETLQIGRIGSVPQIDNGRATQIETALQEIEHRHAVELNTQEMRNGALVTDIPVHQKGPAQVDVNAIRTYLEGGNEQKATTTVSNR